QQVERGEVFVAKSGEGQVIGFVVFSHESLREQENTIVYYLCTSEDYRGQGAGRLLMEAVASDARIRGKRSIDLKC
ncbi:MAG: GNAT family N-acetyltransferase, partial [Desulfobacterales bacterium]|nr:GNAT family N-acetyltransferase [Desulfobacterales bacterium]